MPEGLLNEAAQLSLALRWGRGVTSRLVGLASGRAVTTVVVHADAPALFTLLTRWEYDLPLVNPPTVALESVMVTDPVEPSRVNEPNGSVWKPRRSSLEIQLLHLV